MWEAFLLQMNDFDRLLEHGLRRILDPVAATPAPPRKVRLTRSRKALLNIGARRFEAAAEAIPVIVASPAASTRLQP